MISFKKILSDKVDLERAKGQSYFDLFKERGAKASLHNAFFSLLLFFTDCFVFDTNEGTFYYVCFYFLFTLFDTFKPKIYLLFKSESLDKDS
jgi:hypothetical protein